LGKFHLKCLANLTLSFDVWRNAQWDAACKKE
jgi:hypothetical protein